MVSWAAQAALPPDDASSARCGACCHRFAAKCAHHRDAAHEQRLPLGTRKNGGSPRAQQLAAPRKAKGCTSNSPCPMPASGAATSGVHWRIKLRAPHTATDAIQAMTGATGRERSLPAARRSDRKPSEWHPRRPPLASARARCPSPGTRLQHMREDGKQQGGARGGWRAVLPYSAPFGQDARPAHVTTHLARRRPAQSPGPSRS